jgi:hypothetical protein
MSKIPRIAFVVEGTTDLVILEEVVAKFLKGRDFVPVFVQPEMSELQAIAGENGFGWPGVCRCCCQLAYQAGGQARNNVLLDLNDLLIIQMDADVASVNYRRGHIEDPFPGIITLPCNEPCPPPAATTDRLRDVVLRWLGETSIPPKVVFCIPSKSLETWILVGLFPDSHIVRRENDIECRKHPEKSLRGQDKDGRLISGKHKKVDGYRAVALEFATNWDGVAQRCSQAERFAADFLAAI